MSKISTEKNIKRDILWSKKCHNVCYDIPFRVCKHCILLKQDRRLCMCKLDITYHYISKLTDYASFECENLNVYNIDKGVAKWISRLIN